MSDWFIHIERVSNGYVLTFNRTSLDDEEIVDQRLVEDRADNDYSGIEAGCAMLREVMEHFDLSGSKHDAKRLRVEIEDQRWRDYAEEGEKSDG